MRLCTSPRLGGIGAKLADERLHARDLLLLPLAGGGHLLQLRLAAAQVLREGTGKDAQLAAVDLCHLVAGAIHQRAVVGYQQVAATIGAQVLLKPLARLQVEVVGGLVEEQQVGPLQQQLGQRDAHLPAGGKGGRVLVVLLRSEPEATADAIQARRPVGSAVQADLLGEFAVAGEQPVQRITVAGSCHLLLNATQLLLRGQLAGKCQRQLRAQGAAAMIHPRLRQVGDADLAARNHAPAVGARLTRNDAHQGRFAAAVGAAQSDASAAIDGQTDLVEHYLLAEGDRYLGERNH